MIGFFKLFLLVLLILVEIVTIDKIFDTVTLKTSDKNYKKKLFLKNMVELLILIIFIFILVYKYLEYYSVPTKDAVNVAIILSFLVLIVFVVQNKRELNILLSEGFSNKEHFGECPANQHNIPFLDEKKIFSLVPAIYRDILSENDRYKIACKYPFYIENNLDKSIRVTGDTEDRVDISKYLTILEEEEFDDKDVQPYPAVINYNGNTGPAQFLF